jgi:hypothetical protein
MKQWKEARAKAAAHPLGSDHAKLRTDGKTDGAAVSHE